LKFESGSCLPARASRCIFSFSKMQRTGNSKLAEAHVQGHAHPCIQQQKPHLTPPEPHRTEQHTPTKTSRITEGLCPPPQHCLPPLPYLTNMPYPTLPYLAESQTRPALPYPARHLDRIPRTHNTQRHTDLHKWLRVRLHVVAQKRARRNTNTQLTHQAVANFTAACAHNAVHKRQPFTNVAQTAQQKQRDA
jgi:hypothetical protein